jgi:NADPH2:quinone reductase
MKAAYITEVGPPGNIRFGDLPAPTPAEGECLVRVGAVSVNPIDTYIRSGAVKMALPMPFIVGCDLAGTVERVGTGASKFRPGDRVWGSNQGLLGRQGTFAEFAAVGEQWLYPAPEGIADEQLAALALVSITAYLGLVREARLQRGETLFVTGGTGGVGSAVVQIARAVGCRVITTAGSEAKAETCRRLGADGVILYCTQSVGSELKKLAPEGVNVWWETLREPDFDLAVGALAPRGRMILMAGRDARPHFPVGPFYVKGCSLHGFAMFNSTPAEQQQAAVALNGWIASGAVRGNIDRVLPLSQASVAHQLQEENTIARSGALAGKLVLKP